MTAASPHPFDPLSPEEISRASRIVRPHFGGHDPNFRVITLLEPAKKEMITYLEKEHLNQPIGHVPTRHARVEASIKAETEGNHLFELIVDLDADKVVKKQHVEGKHSYIDTDYMKAVEAACLANEEVQALIKTLDLPEGATVVVEPWAYATDGMNDMTHRVSMCWFYARLLENPNANYYAYPLDVCAEVSESLGVMKVYRLPTTPDERANNEKRPFDRRRIHSPTNSEYHPDLRPSPRSTTKPLHVTQPEGPSFHIEGNRLTWEKWDLRVGFNYREGLTLHDVRYDGRCLFYRLSLAEMFVPYGDPRAPYPRKAAFDLGNDGAGINANNLQLGCDCLGTIKYFDAYHNTSSGEPLKLPNVVCCHEQDDGILWKHTNFRTNVPVVTRSRILVLQTIITVTNYEYIFAWHFSQDASIFYEVRATGILSTAPTSMDHKGTYPYGNIVAPGVLAPYHQHLFSLRIDPAIDGHANSLVVEESKPLPIDDPAIHNPFGVGYVTESQTVEEEGGFDLDFTKARTFKFVNENKINPITGTPVGFKLMPFYSQMLLAHPESFHAKRSEFAEHAVWVTRYEDNDHFPAGKYTMQSAGGDGLASVIARRRNTGVAHSVRNEDIVIWHTFGSTHNPRIEDWPVMPSEKMMVGLKPVNFFSGNPGLDVAPSTQEKNKSVLYTGEDKKDSTCCISKL
ncbi:probable copper amine oxidase [Fusarium mangiferae]|uniref:Amine oxidase n=1 Tax=Fusarium mangiferae TaxID=192010 RepID=A0A1L7SQG3_FUSMA|nr:putative copper amine oxidase [Fusarium mangiferae]CVK86044.1 probable copper amine oxidase [Fusarium mangiferae]